MADNTRLNAGDAGDLAVTREISHGGDTAKLPGSFIMGISGTEGSYTVAAIDGDATNGLDVDVTRCALPSGAATSAKQDTAAAILTTMDADTGAIATSVASIDTKTPALGQALAAASVPVVLTAAQVTTLTPPAAITGFATEAKQDSIIGHVDGIETLLTTIAAAQLPDSHNVTIDNASIAVTGTFWQATQPVSLASVPSHAVTNAGTFVVQENGGALTALQLIDDAIYTAGSGTPSKGALILGSDGTNPKSVSVTTDGHLIIHDGGNAITVDGTVTANAGTNLNTSALALETGGNLAACAASLATLDNCISGNEAQVDVITQPARDRLTDNVGVALQTDVLLNDTTALTPKFAIIDAATSGDNTLVAAVTSKKIRVLSLVMVASGAVNVRFESGASGTALSGQMNLAANGGFTLPFNPLGWFETASGTLLNLELSGATSVDGMLTYVEV